MKELSELGYIPSDWAHVLVYNVSEEAAFDLEKMRLHAIGGTKFNVQSGERNYQAKLTDDQAREIFMRDETHQKLATEFGVSRSAISMIKSRKQWRAATSKCLTA